MPPKRKAKAVIKKEQSPSPIEDNSMSNITIRKRKEKIDIPEVIDCEVPTLPMFKHTNVSVVIEEMSDINAKTAVVKEVSSESNENGRLDKKKVTKGKKKENIKTLNKDTQDEIPKVLKSKKRAESVDRTIIKSEQNVLSKNRKRRVDKNASVNAELLKPLSPTNIPEKRNRRAQSVDHVAEINSTQITKRNRKIVNEDEIQKKNKKNVKKELTKTKKIDDEPQIVEKIVNEVNVEKIKVKKNVKKELNDKEQIEKCELVEKLQDEKPNLISKDTVHVEDEDAVVEELNKKTKKPATKSKKNDKKPKKVVQTFTSPEKSEDSGDNNNAEVNTLNEVKKTKQTQKIKVAEEKDAKEIILPRRGNRKLKVDDYILKRSDVGSDDEGNIKTEDLQVDLLDTLGLDDNLIKPTVTKRKTRARTTKK